MTLEVLGLTESQILSIGVAIVLGFLAGLLVKKIIEVGVLILAIVVILIAIGAISPAEVTHAILNSYLNVNQIMSFINEHHVTSYESIGFIIGFVIGLFRKTV